MKLFDFQRRQQCGVAALTFGTADSLRLADHIDVAGCEQLNKALVEAEGFDGLLNLAVLDIPSRVRPVCNAVRGSTPRIYQKRPSNKPRSIDLIMSSMLTGG